VPKISSTRRSVLAKIVDQAVKFIDALVIKQSAL
jgi:hypothetical protein